MPCNYKDYPPNWKTEIRPAILERDGNKCKSCGVENYATGYRGKDGHFFTSEYIWEQIENHGVDMFAEGEPLSNCWFGENPTNPIRIVLTIAHLDHDLKNNDFSNLAALCQRCHNRLDIEYRKANRKKNKGIQSLF